MTTTKTKREQNFKRLIIAVSIAIPIVVAGLFGVNLRRMGFDVEPLSFLPPIYATINGCTAVLLILAVRAIKNGNKNLHQKLIQIAMGCSVAFLLMYVAYHMTADSTKFGGEGWIKYAYFFILITHIILSVVVIPFVLFTYMRGYLGDYTKHKKIARITYPLWLYVAVTGVIVYLMISPYYA